MAFGAWARSWLRTSLLLLPSGLGNQFGHGLPMLLLPSRGWKPIRRMVFIASVAFLVLVHSPSARPVTGRLQRVGMATKNCFLLVANMVFSPTPQCPFCFWCVCSVCSWLFILVCSFFITCVDLFCSYIVPCHFC